MRAASARSSSPAAPASSARTSSTCSSTARSAGSVGEIVDASTTSRAAGTRTSPTPAAAGRSRSSRATSATASWSHDVMDGADLVFHLAAMRITQCAEDPRLAVDVLGNGTFNVVEAARVRACAHGRLVDRVGVRLAEEFPTTESHHPYNNRTLYGAIKVFNEGLLRSFNDMYGFDYVALRYFNVYGPRMESTASTPRC